MQKILKWLGIAALVLVAIGAYPGYRITQEIAKAVSEDPTVWEADIVALEAATRERGELRDPVLFVGSSSIRFWTSLAEDMAPLETIRHGFGGAKLDDLVHYAERLVNQFEPRAVVVYCRGNAQPGEANSAEVLLASFERFVEIVQRDLPDVPIYYIGIMPTPQVFPYWDQVQATNAALRAYTETSPTLHFIDTTSAFLKEGDDSPDAELFRWDRRHLNEGGYAAWTRIIRSRLTSDL